MLKKIFRRKPAEAEQPSHEQPLIRNLTVKDLTSLGIAAVIGAGIFGTIGNASASGGPAVSLLFIFTSVACLLSALCYAEFASRVPASGSAYTYAYVSLGEIIAWIIGWDLLMEYAIGNIAVAISWSDYFTGFMEGLGMSIPSYLTMDYLTAFNAYKHSIKSTGNETTHFVQTAIHAWNSAPVFAGIKVIFDLPALIITGLVTWLVYVGIKESKGVANVLVGLKLVVVLLFIAVGFFYVNPVNWHPFAPNGMSGILKGISSVFFAYIGFDAISTTAEECKEPRKDLPKAMFYSLLVCTILYVLITLVLTGMVNYKELNVGDPLAYALQRVGLTRFSGVIALSAIVAMTSVLLVFQLGQPRIWMSMSRDGLLPKIFSRIHPVYKTPSFSTILTGICVAVPAMFMNLTEVTDLCSIGTLFAFVVVCWGVLINTDKTKQEGRFKVPYINSRYIMPAAVTFMFILIFSNPSITAGLTNITEWETFKHQILMWFFLLICLAMSILCYRKEYSFIPALGLLVNLYLMTGLGITNWIRFLIWLILGLAIYFLYGIRKSRLNTK